MFGKLFSKCRNFFKKKRVELRPKAEVQFAAQLQLSSGVENDWLCFTESEIKEAIDAAHQCTRGIESEFLSRNVAYRLAVPVSESRDIADAQKYRLCEKNYHFEALGSKDLENEGVFIYGLIHEDPNAPIHIVCRGTEADASIIRDLDPEGPGYASFQRHSPAVIAQLQKLSAKYPGRNINLCGHSLGGALAQIIGTTILKAKADAELGLFKFLTGIEFSIFQSAWVHDKVINEATEAVNIIHKNQPDFSVILTSHVKQGDFVSRTGGTLFADALPEVAEVNLDMRPLDKPILNLEDAVFIGASATLAPNPIAIGVNVAACTGRRFVQNRIEAHTDRFFHESESFDKNELLEDVKKIGYYGILSNKNPEDRPRISHVFKKNDRQHIPGHDSIAEASYDAIKNCSSEEVMGVIACGAAASALVPIATQVYFTAATKTPAQVVVNVAGALPKVSGAVSSLLRHGQSAQRMLTRCWNRH